MRSVPIHIALSGAHCAHGEVGPRVRTSFLRSLSSSSGFCFKKRTALSHASQAISGGGSAWIRETWGLENDTVCPCFEMFDSLVVILLMVQGI